MIFLWQYCHMTLALCRNAAKGVPFAGAIGNNPVATDRS
jgi:hypothetical protein